MDAQEICETVSRNRSGKSDGQMVNARYAAMRDHEEISDHNCLDDEAN
jgi:hypothetical protein